MVLHVSLAEAKPGQIGTIAATCDDPKEAALLRAMGLKPNCRVRVCRLGEPCIVEVIGCKGCGCRIGLARTLARQVKLVCDELVDLPRNAVPAAV